MDNKGFPQYNSNRRTGDLGVTFVRSIVENKFEWMFRPTHLEDDFGIDGYFDIIGRDNSVTGKYLGVQIKTGASYFLSKTNGGWKFAGENKHLNYFLNSNFPVLIILVDLSLQKAFWVEFDVNKTEKTKNGWSITVPEENILDERSKEKLSGLTGDVIDYMPQIEYQWEINEQIKECSIAFICVGKNEILTKDVRGFGQLSNRLTISEEMITKSRGKISFFIDGYDNDPREIYEIPEVRTWIKLVVPTFKYWGYFLNMDAYLKRKTGFMFLLLCSVEVKVVANRSDIGLKTVKYDVEEAMVFFKQIFSWLNEFCNKYAIPQKINKEQSDLILRTLE